VGGKGARNNLNVRAGPRVGAAVSDAHADAARRPCRSICAGLQHLSGDRVNPVFAETPFSERIGL